MLGNLINKLKRYKFKDKYINVIVVPGNHDLNLENNDRNFDDIIKSYKNNTFKNFIDRDLISLSNFYEFANLNKCFNDEKIVSCRKMIIGNKKVKFSLLNTAIFSLCGSSNQDMGIHYLSEENINNLIIKEEVDLNILVMHHSIEWFQTNIKEKLRKIISENFDIVFAGHEHDAFVENRNINNKNSTIFIQGNALSGDRNHEKGFTTVVYDTDKKKVYGSSYIWNNDYYKRQDILDCFLEHKQYTEFINNSEFFKEKEYDIDGILIDKYFVFPSLEYKIRNNEGDLETKTIDSCNELIDVILKNDKTVISGDIKSGKSTLAMVLYKELRKKRFVPILLLSEDLRHKRIDKVIEYAFKEQYIDYGNLFDKFSQLNKNEKILIIDDAGKVEPKIFSKMLNEFYNQFSKTILISEEKINLNIQKQIVDALTEEKIGQLNIKPFLYNKRKELISKLYNLYSTENNSPNNKEMIRELNNMISSQIRYFRLDPEFIKNYVIQYMSKLNYNLFSTGKNVFSIVYENSIKNNLIKHSEQSDVGPIFNVLQEVAYYMHFNKKVWITDKELSSIIENYNKDYRQNLKISSLLLVGNNSKLIIEEGSKIRFKDSNLLAYFVAQALNRKYFYDSELISEKIEYILHHLCFGINSDIILFMALITNNIQIINTILCCADKHFENIEELSFDKNNIKFLCESDFSVKDTIPNEKEKKEKENKVVKYEEELKSSETVEIIDEYDYDENEINSAKNILFKSIKYIEILSKILPAFCHNMQVKQQDKLVYTIYSYTNRFLFQSLNKISRDYNNFVEQIFNEVSEIRKEKNISDINIDNVKKVITEIGISLLISLYQLVVHTATTKETIKALEAFDYEKNSNYLIMNLMMIEREGNLKEFKRRAISIYNNSELKIIKSLVKFTVRNYFLNHDIKIVGEAQSLLDKFFGASENEDKKKIKDDITKNKLKYK